NGQGSTSRRSGRKLCYNQLDRFIPNRSAMGFDYAHYMLMEAKKGKENPVASSPAKEAYSNVLGNTVYLWDATDSSTSELMTVDEDTGPITSVSSAPDGRRIAVGLNILKFNSGILHLTNN
ncbi:hypothetical protein MKW98_020026, partial [Papaver atlanticum]